MDIAVLQPKLLSPDQAQAAFRAVDELREAQAFLRSLAFRRAPDGKELLSKLNNVESFLAEAGFARPTKARRRSVDL